MWNAIQDWWDDHWVELFIVVAGIAFLCALLIPISLSINEQNKITPEPTPIEQGIPVVLRYYKYPIRIYEDTATGDRYLMSDRGGIVRLTKREDDR